MKSPKQESYKVFLKRNLWKAILFVSILSASTAFLALNLDFLSPFQKAFKDFDVSDLAYSQFERGRYFEDQIILINIGKLPRRGIAQLLDTLSQYKPAVVGVDAFFSHPKNPEDDAKLTAAMQKIPNLVLVSKLELFSKQKGHYESLKKSAPIFSEAAYSGFANFITGGVEGKLTTRRYTPQQKVKDSIENCFSGEILKRYNLNQFHNYYSGLRETEYIQFNNNMNGFLRFNHFEILKGGKNLEVLRDKIVLMGYLGEPMGEKDLTDIFFTPLNEDIAGRSLPDMFGVVVHANILSMMLHGKTIYKIGKFWEILLTVLILYFNSRLFLYWVEFRKSIFEVGVRVVQFVQIALFTYISIYLLGKWNVKFETGLIMLMIAASADCIDIFHSLILGGKWKTLRKKIRKHTRVTPN